MALSESALQIRRIKVAEDLAEAPTLLKELENCQIKNTVAQPDDLLAWRERPHDDLVLAVAIAALQAERCNSMMWLRFIPEVIQTRPTWWGRR